MTGTTALTNDNTGGTWSIDNTGLASINPATGVVNGISAGNVLVAYAVTNSCGSALTQAGLIVHYLPDFSLGNDTAICVGSKLLITCLTGNASFVWEDGSTMATHLVSQPQLYWLKATDGNGCSFSNTIAIQNKPLPLVHLGNDTTLCNNLSLMLTAKEASIISYQWQDASTEAAYLVRNPGQYSVVVTGTNGCKNGDTIKVSYLNSPQVTLGIGGTICPGNPVIIDPHLANVNYLWQDASTKPTYTVTDPGIYSLTASNFCGNSIAKVEFKRGLCWLVMPNAFTPNNDRVNDIFRVPHPDFIRTFQFTIFNRWGEKIFETTATGQGWNGKYKGTNQDTGNYTWFITLTDFEGNIESAKGSVVLIR